MRRLAEMDVKAGTAAVAQHCSAGPGGALSCPVVSAKQRKRIELYASLTQTPSPDMDAMTHDEASAWIRARFQDYMTLLT